MEKGLMKTRNAPLLAAMLAQIAAARGDVEGVERAAREVAPARKPHEPHQGAREMARRRKQRACAGLAVVEPAPVDLATCAETSEEATS